MFEDMRIIKELSSYPMTAFWIIAIGSMEAGLIITVFLMLGYRSSPPTRLLCIDW
jgi:hypothetical protein